jgi:hypothetical protein
VTNSSSPIPAGYLMCTPAFRWDGIDRVQREGAARKANAHRADGNYYRVNADASVSSPRILRTASAGPVLTALHQNDRLIEILSSMMHRELRPTRSSFNFYSPGDYIGRPPLRVSWTGPSSTW